eukprot:11109018-Ditylum_brightwellii.AAC.1
MEDREAWDNAICPCWCGKELEDPEHWGAKKAAAPGLMAAFVHGLDQWRNCDHPTPPCNASIELIEAFQDQLHI